MTSDKSYTSEQRLNALVPRVGTNESNISSLQADPMISSGSLQDTGGLQNGWGKGSGFFKYQRIGQNWVYVQARGLNCSGATVTDGTAICSSSNGLPSSCRPATSRTLPAVTDGGMKSTNIYASLHFMADGSIQCFGVSTSATVLDCAGLIDFTV